MADKKIAFELGDKVKLISLSVNQEICKGFKIGQTGQIVGFVAKEYPLVKWDTLLFIFGELLEQSDCHYSRLEKVKEDAVN